MTGAGRSDTVLAPKPRTSLRRQSQSAMTELLDETTPTAARATSTRQRLPSPAKYSDRKPTRNIVSARPAMDGSANVPGGR